RGLRRRRRPLGIGQTRGLRRRRGRDGGDAGAPVFGEGMSAETNSPENLKSENPKSENLKSEDVITASVTRTCDPDELRTLFLFEKLTDDQLAWLCERGRVEMFPTGP